MEPTGKPALRQHCRQLRRQSLSSSQPLLATAALGALPDLLPTGQRLGLYWPIGAEPDLRDLAAATACALPAVMDGRLLYRPWQPGEVLIPDQCGIPAPTGNGALMPTDLGLLLAPALAFDRRGIRLGYGGGWFDRLRSDPGWRAVPALAVLPRACLLEQLPAEPWDVPFDGWLDERGVHWLQRV